MNGSESAPSGFDGAPQPPPSRPRPFLLEPVFVGPNGVRAGWRAALFVSLFLLFLTMAADAARLLHLSLLGQPGPITPRVLGSQEALAVVCALLAALILARLERRPFGDYGMPLAQAFGKHFWIGAVWGVGAMSAMIFLIHALGGYSLGAIDLPRAALARYALEWAAVFLLVGVYEEFFFRGYLLFTLSSGMRFWPAALLLSFLFGAVHLRNPGEGPVGALSVFVIGMFFCFTLRRTGTLWFAIGFHAAWDYCETYLYSVPDSGIVMPGHLLSSSFHGPAWLTGGTIGPEGSIFDFVVLAVVFVIFDRIYPDRIYPTSKAYPAPSDPGRGEGPSLLPSGEK
jgi:membrane protease YdiL (CAAX protease family)